MRESLTHEELAAIPEATTYGPWSRLEMLTARVGDLIAQLSWMQSTGEAPPPDPLPRPGVIPPQSAAGPASLSYAKAYLDEVLRNHGAPPAPDWHPDDSEGG